VPENDQDEEQLETDCWHDQKVHGSYAGRMVTKEGLPAL
jgi:hypothetical protein